jgi:hypothetical protein
LLAILTPSFSIGFFVVVVVVVVVVVLF